MTWCMPPVVVPTQAEPAPKPVHPSELTPPGLRSFNPPPTLEARMRTLSMVHHRVADFDAWKQVYDGVVDVQRGGGVVFHQVLRDQSDPNMVVVTHSFDSSEE